MNRNEFTLKCPVCDALHGDTEPSVVGCTNCGFSEAFVQSFGSEESYRHWLNRMTVLKEKYQTAYRLQRVTGLLEKFGKNGCLKLGNNILAFVNPDTHIAKVIRTNGNVAEYSEVADVVFGGYCAAFLKTDGRVEVKEYETGGNTYEQCNVGEWKTIRSILETGDCTYGITANGSVIKKGKTDETDSTISEWRNIQKLAGSRTHILGLTANGRVVFSKAHTGAHVVGDWENVSMIAAAADCSLALHTNGTVSFAGRSDDPRVAVSGWKNMIAIAMDDKFAVGIDNAGKIFCEGRGSVLGMDDRKNVKNWQNTFVMIACNEHGIAGVDMNGDVHIAGVPSLNSILSICSDNIRPQMLP